MPCSPAVLPALRTAVSFVTLIVVSGAVGAPAAAAVRLCKAPVSSGLVTGASEREARKAALDAWRAKALVDGEPYASWRIAADKLLACEPRKSGGYECLARATPCTIEQAPGRRELRQKRIGI